MHERAAAGSKGPVHPPIRSIREALSFRIARLAALNERAGSYHFQATLGLRLNEWRVLGLVASCAPAPTTFAELRDILLIDKGQLSRVVAGLVGRELLQSRPLDSDARQVSLTLTDEGRAVHDVALSFTQTRNEVVVSSLTPDECRTFLRLLDRVLTHNEALARAGAYAP